MDQNTAQHFKNLNEAEVVVDEINQYEISSY